MSRSSAIRTIQKLVEVGLISASPHYTRDGDRTSNDYTILNLTPGSITEILPPSVTDTPVSIRNTPEQDTANKTKELTISDKSEKNNPEGIPHDVTDLDSGLSLHKKEVYADTCTESSTLPHDGSGAENTVPDNSSLVPAKRPRGRPRKNSTDTNTIILSSNPTNLGAKGRPINPRFELYRAYCTARGEDAEADDIGKGMKLRQITEDMIRTMTPEDITSLYNYVYGKWARAAGGTPQMKPTIAHLKRDYAEWKTNRANVRPSLPAVRTHEVTSHMDEFQRRNSLFAKCKLFKSLMDDGLRDLSDLPEHTIKPEEYQSYLDSLSS
jgi:hypothetical protein